MECEAYGELRKCLMITEGRSHMWLMVDDQEWMLDALIGHGVCNKVESWRVVLSYINNAMKLRGKFIIR